MPLFPERRVPARRLDVADLLRYDKSQPKLPSKDELDAGPKASPSLPEQKRAAAEPPKALPKAAAPEPAAAPSEKLKPPSLSDILSDPSGASAWAGMQGGQAKIPEPQKPQLRFEDPAMNEQQKSYFALPGSFGGYGRRAAAQAARQAAARRASQGTGRATQEQIQQAVQNGIQEGLRQASAGGAKPPSTGVRGYAERIGQKVNEFGNAAYAAGAGKALLGAAALTSAGALALGINAWRRTQKPSIADYKDLQDKAVKDAPKQQDDPNDSLKRDAGGFVVPPAEFDGRKQRDKDGQPLGNNRIGDAIVRPKLPPGANKAPSLAAQNLVDNPSSFNRVRAEYLRLRDMVKLLQNRGIDLEQGLHPGDYDRWSELSSDSYRTPAGLSIFEEGR